MQKFKIRLTTEYEIERPDDWDSDLLLFQLTESSWCADNALEDIKNWLKDQPHSLGWYSKFEVLE